MRKSSKLMLLTAAAVTVASLVTWQATGGDWYTKYEVVELVESNADPNDPLVAAGFYEGNMTTMTVVKDEFRFGLLPTPSSLFDKHAISVASVTGPMWALGLVAIWYRRRCSRLHQSID